MQFLRCLSKKTLLATTAAVVFSGCMGGMMPKKQEASLPSWYLNAPANNAVFIYGEGESTSVKEAKNNALNTMASKLVVSVGSSMKTTTKTSRDGSGASSYSKDVTKDVKVDVQKIKFTNAKVEKSVKVGNNIYILMKVNRQELFENKKKEFDIIDRRLDEQYNRLSTLPKLEKISTLQEMYPNVIKAKKQSIVLNAIDNSFDHGPFMAKFDSYIDKISELKSTSTISVTTNSSDRYFADSLIDLLNQNQYKIASNSDIVIKLTNKIKYSNYKGWNVAKVTTTISVISAGKTISNKIINSVGKSSTSKGSALEGASADFIRKVKKETLDKVIFSK